VTASFNKTAKERLKKATEDLPMREKKSRTCALRREKKISTETGHASKTKRGSLGGKEDSELPGAKRGENVS